jgi:hypothetical protein
MQGASKIFLFCGVILSLYAAFSRFYGEPSIAFNNFKSINILIAANTLILIAVALKLFARK